MVDVNLQYPHPIDNTEHDKATETAQPPDEPPKSKVLLNVLVEVQINHYKMVTEHS